MGQKTPDDWPLVEHPSISNDGKFAAYSVSYQTGKVSLILTETDGSWKKEFNGVRVYSNVFNPGSHWAIFKNNGDSLAIVELGTDHIRYIQQVKDFKLPEDGDGASLVYQSKTIANKVLLLNLTTGTEKQFTDIAQYLFDKHGQTLVLKQVIKSDKDTHTNVFWVNTADNLVKTICQTEEVGSQFIFDAPGKKMAFFTAKTSNSQLTRDLRCYISGKDSAEIVINSKTPDMTGKMVSEQTAPFFSPDGHHIVFSIQTVHNQASKKFLNTGAAVVVRGIHDADLNRAKQAQGLYLVATNLNDPRKKVIRLQQETDSFAIFSPNSDWLLFTRSNVLGDPGREGYYKVTARPDIFLVSIKDGKRRLIRRRAVFSGISFSPNGRYVTWFDKQEAQWYAHNIILNRTVEISQNITEPITDIDNKKPGLLTVFQDEVSWLKNDEALFIYGRNDIWQLDPNDQKPPIDITSGYGIKRHVRLRFQDFLFENEKSISKADTIFLSAFDQDQQNDGFFKLILAKKGLSKLTLSSFCYTCDASFGPGGIPRNFSKNIVKARQTNNCLVTRMSATAYPNLYVTSDFRDFKPLTEFHPQKAYNWYTTELIHWTLPNGKPGVGTLYKPENFNPQKKYPVIFYYYEQCLKAVNTFIQPGLSHGILNIPYYLSHGYLVFVPDINYKIGYPGKSACDAVTSAALYLSKKNWVDVKHIGLQGHSFGGFETNYIVTHSKLFAAAAPASAVSNVIEAYGDDLGEQDGASAYFFERGQGRTGWTLWQRPDLYIENSPIMRAYKVTTPLLIMHTRQDSGVPYVHGLQWYNDLRRLGKKAWLLTYDGENHVLKNEKNQLDYSIRLAQFFDYYLKGALPPKWMTQGVDRTLNGNDDQFELDTSGAKP